MTKTKLAGYAYMLGHNMLEAQDIDLQAYWLQAWKRLMARKD
jgi:hypothetical protein